MALAALHCRRTNTRSITSGWSCCAFTVVTSLATLVLGAFSASYIAHELLGHIPQLEAMNNRLDEIVAALPSDLRLIVHRNGSVDINRVLPFGMAVTLGTWQRRIAFEDASHSLTVLRRKYSQGSAGAALDVILSGSRLLALDADAMTPAQNASFHAGRVVPLTYRVFDLGRERSVELPLSTLCEALSDEELTVALDVEAQLATGRAGGNDKALAPLQRGATPSRLLVAARRNRKSLLYFNSTALQRAAGDVAVPLHRWNALWTRLNGSSTETAALVRAGTLRLVGIGDSVAEGVTATAPPVAAPGSGVGLTSNFVCTRETVSTALEGMRSDQFINAVPWRLILQGAAISIQVVCTAAFAATVLAFAVIAGVATWPC